MTRRAARLWTVGGSSLVTLLACAPAAPGTDDSGAGGTESELSTGGTTSSGGSLSGSGGAEQSSGGNQGSGGILSGSGGVPAGGCSDALACGVGFTCYAPGATPPVLCGTPLGWCGQCLCPPMPPLPLGTGQACDDTLPCPERTDENPSVASICDESSGTCQMCASNDDCSGGEGYCGTGPSGYATCHQCASNDDCTETAPFCGPSDGSLGACRECRVTADCELGLCNEAGFCEPGCDSDDDCDPNDVCGAEQRCVRAPCTSNADCSAQATCTDQACYTKTCTTDAECSGGYCVSGVCRETPGFCQPDKVP
jgi:hypothetical protein